MNFAEYPEKDGKRVWLSQDEIEQLLNAVEPDTTKRTAIGLGAYCGLRTEEIVQVAAEDVVESEMGYTLRVWESAKTGEYRETPIPSHLANTIWTIGDMRDDPRDAPVIDKSKRTLRRWMDDATETLLTETSEPGWAYVGFHDLRRTWATQLRSADVDAMVVLDWGGWSDLETFLDHYRGTHTPEAQRRERQKVDWL